MNHDFKEGRISFASHGKYTIIKDSEEYLSVLSGKFHLNNNIFPAVGDYVRFIHNPYGESIIEEVLPRKSLIKRKSAGKTSSENVLAANVDIMLIVTPMDKTFSIRRIERFLVLASAGDVEPVIVISKSDTCDPVDMAVGIGDIEAVTDAKIIETSSLSGYGIEEVRSLISGEKTFCAVGTSGAGKSTLLNKIMGRDVAGTSHIRDKDDKGRHTTTGRQMYQLSNGACFVDTPGLREVGITDDMEAVDDVFRDITSLAEFCFFSDCSHLREPSCAVLEALSDGRVSKERYDSYIKLRRESENHAVRTQDKAKKKRQEKTLSKLVKAENKRKKKF
jgi:ribosome biogenesis GTPase